MYVLMVVPSDFPNGDAGAVRDMAFASIFHELGYKVYLIGAGKGERQGCYKGVHYYSIFRDAQNKIDHLKRFIASKSAYMTVINLIIHKEGLPSVIYLNDISHGIIEQLRTIAVKHDIPILHDSTEWYSPCEFTHGKLDKAYILKDRLNRKIIRQPIRVIGISCYLTEYFQRRGLKAVRIPAIMDVKKTTVSVNKDEKIKLIYAGSPANKDYLKEIVLGVVLLAEDDQKKIEMHILGANEDQIKDLTGLQFLPDCIKAYGRVSREKVEDAMLGMDFSVLLRPSDERYAKAGFPTKSVEAMSHGVAMICNLSSDLGMYLRDGENAVIVDGYTEEDFSKAISRILSLDRNGIDKIKLEARRTAENNFDYRLWSNKIKELLN